MVNRIDIGHVDQKHAGHRLINAGGIDEFERGIADLHRRVKDGAFRRHGAARLGGAKDLGQKIDHWRGFRRMQIRLQSGRAFGEIVIALEGGDIPVVAERILHTGGALAPGLVCRLLQRNRTCRQRFTPGSVDVRHVNMKCHGAAFAPPRDARTAPSDHHHAIADAGFAMVATGRRGTERLLGTEDFRDEIDHARDIPDDRVWR